MRFNIASLLHKPQGARERFELDAPLEVADTNDGVSLSENVRGKVQFLKLPHEINVQITDLKTTANAICNRCLTPFLVPIHVPVTEREFIIDLLESDLEPGEDVFYVRKGRNEIELNDMIRQEILLHFPGVPVCSRHCKGLCDRCGINLNTNTCSCVHPPERGNNPFKLPF